MAGYRISISAVVPECNGAAEVLPKCVTAVAGQDFTPRIHVSDSDFMAITRNGALCRPNGGLGPAEFEVVMRDQLRLYAHTCLSTASHLFSAAAAAAAAVGRSSGGGGTGIEMGLVCAAKLLLADQAALHRAISGLAAAVAVLPRGPWPDHRASAVAVRAAVVRRRRCHSLDAGSGLAQLPGRQPRGWRGAVPGGIARLGGGGRLEEDQALASDGRRSPAGGVVAAEGDEGGAASLLPAAAARPGIGGGQGSPQRAGAAQALALVRGGEKERGGASVGRARFKASLVHAGWPAPPPPQPPPSSPPQATPDLMRHGGIPLSVAAPAATERLAAWDGVEARARSALLAGSPLLLFPDTDMPKSVGDASVDNNCDVDEDREAPATPPRSEPPASAPRSPPPDVAAVAPSNMTLASEEAGATAMAGRGWLWELAARCDGPVRALPDHRPAASAALVLVRPPQSERAQSWPGWEETSRPEIWLCTPGSLGMTRADLESQMGRSLGQLGGGPPVVMWPVRADPDSDSEGYISLERVTGLKPAGAIPAGAMSTAGSIDPLHAADASARVIECSGLAATRVVLAGSVQPLMEFGIIHPV